MKTLLLLLSVLVVPALASAQPSNPPQWRASFTSPDHAVMTRYEWGFFLAGATAPIQNGGIVSIGLPGPDPNGTILAVVDTRPLAVGLYELRVRGVQIANGVAFPTDWSEPLPFVRAPRPPENLQKVP